MSVRVIGKKFIWRQLVVLAFSIFAIGLVSFALVKGQLFERSTLAEWSMLPHWGRMFNLTSDSAIASPTSESIDRLHADYGAARTNVNIARNSKPYVISTSKHTVEVHTLEKGNEFIVRATASGDILARRLSATVLGDHFQLAHVRVSPNGEFAAIEGLSQTSIVRTKIIVLTIPTLQNVASAMGRFAAERPWSASSSGLYIRQCVSLSMLSGKVYCRNSYLPLGATIGSHLYWTSSDADVFEEPKSNLVFSFVEPQVGSLGQLFVIGRRVDDKFVLVNEPLLCSSGVRRLTVTRGAIWALITDANETARLKRYGSFEKEKISCPVADPNHISLSRHVGRISLVGATEEKVFVRVRNPNEAELYLFDKSGQSEKVIAVPKAQIEVAETIAPLNLLPATLTILPLVGDPYVVVLGADLQKTLATHQQNEAESKYVLEIRLARSKDGTDVPISVWSAKQNLKPAGVVVNVYGAYGDFEDTRLSTDIATWLDLGYQRAFCHARGGGALGEAWHIGGRGANKRATIDDTIACARLLKEQSTKMPVVVIGGSAGGLAASAAALIEPQWFDAVVLVNPLLNLAKEFEGKRLEGVDYEEFGTLLAGRQRSGLPYDPTELAITLPRRKIPPVLLIVSERDRSVLPEQSVVFARTLIQYQLPTLILVTAVAGQDHRISTSPNVALDVKSSIYAHVVTVLCKTSATECLAITP